MENLSLHTVLDTFSKHTVHPVNFLGLDKNVSNDLKSNIKDLYDFTKQEETNIDSKIGGKSLKELIVRNFDFEQIWHQIELQNDDVMDTAVKELSSLLVAKNKLIFKSLNKEIINYTDCSDPVLEEDIFSTKKRRRSLDYKSSGESSSEYENDIHEFEEQKQKGSVVDDEFFKLKEMEDFLEKEENPKPAKQLDSESDDDEEGSVDLFEENSEDSGEDAAKTARFNDYFVAQEENEPKRKTNRLMQELEEDNSESEPDNDDDLLNELQSTLELRQERLKKKIENLEDQAISDKPWQLKGEITAESRPQNSLLAEIVEFDLTSRPAPIITEQTSLQLEDIILQRIKHKTFDSVEKKHRPVETPLEYKKKLVLDQEKSKQSLANIYEKEFLDQQAALDKDKMDMEDVEPEIHKEVKKLMKNLFTKLDALANFHFTSTPAIPELKIISNLPAVNMEEVAPVVSSDAALLAPEEIRNKSKGEIVGKQEKTRTDKKRERRKKKLKQKIHSQRKAKIDSSVPKKQRVMA